MIRNRRATQPPAHFHRNPPGRGRLAVFPRCSLLTYESRYARCSRLEKQPTDLRRKACYFGDRTLTASTRNLIHNLCAHRCGRCGENSESEGSEKENTSTYACSLLSNLPWFAINPGSRRGAWRPWRQGRLVACKQKRLRHESNRIKQGLV